MLVDGKQFVEIGNKRAGQLAKQTDADKLLGEQLPEGATLDEMLGACPGAVGKFD